MITKVCSNKLAAVVSIVGIVMFTIALIGSLKIFYGVAFLPFILLCVLVGNRLAYIVTYDAEKNILYRKGLFFGYKYQLNVEDIEDVVTRSDPKEGMSYILVDPYNNRYHGCYKNSFIRLEQNDKNLKFIRQFWNKPIVKHLPQEALFRNK